MRELKKREKDLEVRGVSEGDITGNGMPHKYIAVLLRGLLIFLGAYGTVWGLACSFDLAYEPVKVFTGILILSVFSASVYYNRATFYTGYVLMFLSFFFFSVVMYSYINSGFQAFVNELNEHYVDYFSLPALRVSDEIIADRSLTVPIACIFLGWVYCIMLNVTISSYMNPVLTFLITFLPLQAAFYIDIIPPYLCLSMLIMCYASVLVLSRAGNYALPYRYKKYESFARRRSHKGYEDSYILSARGMLSVFAVSVIFSLIFFVVSGAIFGETYSTRYVSNKLKNKTDDYVEIIVMNGITSIFNRYTATGGLAHGRLGGVGSVTPDYKTDLEVTYVPLSTDVIYLRAFVGNKYAVDRFMEDDSAEYEKISEPFVASTQPMEMHIDNIDADTEYFYLPYHSVNVTGDTAGGSDIIYYPETGNYTDEIDNKGMYDYSLYAFQNYVSIPESLIPVLDETVRKADMIGDDRTAAGMLYSCDKLRQYFEENYRYSLQPGMTPLGKDVIGYFLTSQDRGYCMHYASSATLLLRYIGIPARYCEGYVLKPSDLAQGEKISEDEDGRVTVKVELTDASAHAWVEVYLAGYGWTPYEMTPPSFGDDDEALPANGLMGILSGLFSSANRDEAGGADESGAGQSGVATGIFNRITDSLEYLIRPLGYSVVAVILLVLMVPFTKYLFSVAHTFMLKRRGHFSEALLVSYRSYTRKLYKKKLIGTVNADTTAVSEELAGILKGDEEKSMAESVALTVREAAFSGNEISKDEYDNSRMYMKKILKVITS